MDEKTSKELSKRRAKRFRGWFISCFKTPREKRGRSSRWEKKTYQSTKVDQALIELMDYVQEEIQGLMHVPVEETQTITKIIVTTQAKSFVLSCCLHLVSM